MEAELHPNSLYKTLTWSTSSAMFQTLAPFSSSVSGRARKLLPGHFRNPRLLTPEVKQSAILIGSLDGRDFTRGVTPRLISSAANQRPLWGAGPMRGLVPATCCVVARARWQAKVQLQPQEHPPGNRAGVQRALGRAKERSWPSLRRRRRRVRDHAWA